MIDYQAIAELVSQIPADTWSVLREIKQCHPGMMLSELIEYNLRASRQRERLELRSPIDGANSGGSTAIAIV